MENSPQKNGQTPGKTLCPARKRSCDQQLSKGRKDAKKWSLTTAELFHIEYYRF
jgi:hypothetical protein